MKMKTLLLILIPFFLTFGCEKNRNIVKEEIDQDKESIESIIEDTPVPPVEQYINPDEVKQFLLGYWYFDEGYYEWRNKKGLVYKMTMTDGREFVYFGEKSKFTHARMATGSGYHGDWNVRRNPSSVLLDMKWTFSSDDSDESIYGEDLWKIEKIDQNHINITFYRDKDEKTARFAREETGIKKSIDNDNIEELREYLRNENNNIDERMLFNYTPLMYAITERKTNAALFLIEQGADLSLQSTTGHTPLHYAVTSSNFEDNIVLNILKKGVNVNSKDGSNQTPLDFTILDHFDEDRRLMQRLLTEYGAICSKQEWQDEVNRSISLIRRFVGHSNYIRSVTFSPDDTRILSGSEDGTMKLWEISTGQEIRTFYHTEKVTAVAFSPDGKQALSSSAREIFLRDISTGRIIKTFTGHSKWVECLAFSPDGTQFISGSEDYTVKLWDISTGQEIRTFSGHAWEVRDVAFSPDGKYILSSERGSRKSIILWDTYTGQEIKTFAVTTGTDTVSIAFSPDGKHMLSGGGERIMRLWDLVTGNEIRRFQDPRSENAARNVPFNSVRKVLFNSDGSQIIVCWGNGIIQFFDFDTGSEIMAISINVAGIGHAALSNDNRRLVTSSSDHMIRLWDTTVR